MAYATIGLVSPWQRALWWPLIPQKSEKRPKNAQKWPQICACWLWFPSLRIALPRPWLVPNHRHNHSGAQPPQ